jgi:hypothetical protein
MAGTTGRDRITASDLRVSDAERDAVAAELAEHLKDGRLQPEEFEERVGQAVGARTRGDLDRLLTDLPRAEAVQPPVRRRAGPPFPLVGIVIFAAAITLLGGIGRAAAEGGHPVWAIWWLWWLIPIMIFAACRRFGGYRPRPPRQPAGGEVPAVPPGQRGRL